MFFRNLLLFRIDPGFSFDALEGALDDEIHWMEKSAHCVVLDGELEQIGEITLRFLDRILNQS